MQERLPREVLSGPAFSHSDDACGHDHAGHSHGPRPAPGARTEATLVSARGVTLRRDRRIILQDIDLDINAGEIVTLIGPNGAGKTTLVRTLLGIQRPDTGEVWRKDGLVIGYAPQRFDVDPSIPMTVARFVAMGAPKATTDDIVKSLTDVGASKLDERQLSELSGGELQRVILARALVRDPQLLLLDEPVREVDFIGEAELYTLIGQLRTERGLGVLLISHDLHIVMAQSDRVICLNRHICCSGVPQSVAKDPEYARLFGPGAARALGLYLHQHDHRHDLTGEPQAAPSPRAPRSSPES